MATFYIRQFNFKDSLSDAQVVEELKFLLEEAVPAMLRVDGIQRVNFWSGAGGLRADLTVTMEMDDSGAYERLLADPDIGRIIARVYGAWDLKSSRQTFRRKITPEFIAALSGR
jgi:hypothetical protein